MKPPEVNPEIPPKSSWETMAAWYDSIVGKEGHYYHRNVILPGIRRLMPLTPKDRILELACGQGVFLRALPKRSTYVGIDGSPSLLEMAKNHPLPPYVKAQFYQADITQPLPLVEKNFTHCAILLALQNTSYPEGVIQNAATHLAPGGSFLLVLNHPCFRVPKQSSWEIDPSSGIQYRKIQRYLSAQKVAMQVHPSQQDRSPVSWAYHQPLSFYFSLLKKYHFLVSDLEEWVSDKRSVGAAAHRENTARNEFPLFLALVAKKQAAVTQEKQSTDQKSTVLIRKH